MAKKPEPAFRVVDGKRIDLKKLRERRKVARAKVKPPIEDTRVSDVWVRADAQVGVARRKAGERKRMKPLADGGFDGAIKVEEKIKISGTRASGRTVRCRPGTFEWRYGRNDDSLLAYLYAGSHFADMYERAGIASMSGPGMESNGGEWKGLPDGRVAALDELRPLYEKLGELPRLRLIAYCVQGLPVSQIAQWAGVPARDMGAIVHSDMTALTKHLHYL